MKCAQTFLITEQNMSYLIIPYKTIQMINFANGTVTDICYTTLQWVVKFSQNIAKTKIKAKVCFHFIHSLQDLKVSFEMVMKVEVLLGYCFLIYFLFVIELNYGIRIRK